MKPKWNELLLPIDWQQFLSFSDIKLCVLIKHSTACPISYNGFKEFDSFCRRNRKKEAAFGLVKVIQSREISNQIESDLSLKHESPQVIFIYKRKVLASRTHWSITLEWMEEQLSIFSKEFY
ncbi:MAG: hypothetical protein RLZZ267_465 [Bacillota bacterium]|jgi:bacillithiol system protein YtxJ